MTNHNNNNNNKNDNDFKLRKTIQVKTINILKNINMEKKPF